MTAFAARLPATGNALFHLGALLVPIDIAALALRSHTPWPQVLLIDSVVSALLLAVCARAPTPWCWRRPHRAG